jgi:hypothetical protein
MAGSRTTSLLAVISLAAEGSSQCQASEPPSVVRAERFLLLSAKGVAYRMRGQRFLLLSGHLPIGCDHFVIFLSLLTTFSPDSSYLSPRK